MALLYNLPSGATAAYGLSKLLNSYAGSACRVRRSSDSVETDIGFDANGYLDVASLASFQGTAAETTLVTLYDQTGNGNHATQSSASAQPLIGSYSGGVWSLFEEHPVSGRAGAKFDGLEYLSLPSLYTPTGFSTLMVFKPNLINATEQFLYNLATSNEASTGQLNRFVAGEIMIRNLDSVNDVRTSESSLVQGQPYVATNFYESATPSSQSYLDGSLFTGTSPARRAFNNNHIGSRNGTDYYLSGAIYAFIIYQSDEGANATSINAELDAFFQQAQLFSSGITTGASSLGSPTASNVNVLSATGITTAPPSTAAPTASAIANLSANNITTGVASLGNPSFPSAVTNPIVPQTNIIVNGQKLHIFPDYKIGLSLNYSAGSIEGLEAAISDRFELPFDDYNAGILGVNLGSLSAGQRFDCQIEDEASNTIYNGYLEVVSANIQTLYKSIEVRFVDRVKQFINTLKDTKLHELITAGEFDHDFQLAKPADTFSGVETLVSNSDFVRYVYTDYNGFDNLNVAALHRYNEDFAGGDGIQHLQPAFKVNEFINRIENFTGETINSQLFSNSISGIDTDKLYFQMPMRYHGFNTALREDDLNLTFKNKFMYCGFPEAEMQYPVTGDPINYRDRNRSLKLKASMSDAANNFEIFMRDSIPVEQDWMQNAIASARADMGQGSQFTLSTFFQTLVGNHSTINTNTVIASIVAKVASYRGLLALRSGVYKLSGTVTLPELNLLYIDPDQVQSNAFLHGIQSFTGDIVLNLGVIINSNSPQLIPIKTYNHTDFNTTSSTSVVAGGQTYYNFLQADADTIDYTSDEIEIRMGDRVEFVWVFTGSASLFNVGRQNSTGGVNYIAGLSLFDMSNTTGYSNLIATWGNGTGSIPAPFNSTTKPFLDSISDGADLNHTPTMSAVKEYPLCGIPQSRILTNPALPAEYESVDFKENVKRFADMSVYDILLDIMGRFNMSSWYNHSNGQFYFDNFAEQFIRLATAQNIKANFDDDEVLNLDLRLPNVKSIELVNEQGEAHTDIVLSEYSIGTYPNEVLDQDETEDLSYSSLFSLATGKNYGDPVELTDPLPPSEKFLRFYSKNENLQVSQYGLRIGFISDNTEKITVGTPHPANFFLPQPVNVHQFVRYKARQNSAFFLPTFQQIDETNNLTLEFAVEENGVMNPEPTTITTTYQKFWKWYVENMFGTVGFEGSFVFSKSDIKTLSPLQTYDFGYGDCIIESIDSFDLTQEKDKVRIKLRKI